MFETSKKANAAQEIDYQSNSVVSKILVKKATGNVTLFAFDKDEMLSPHSAPFDAMVQVIEGTAEIMIGEEFFTLNAGEFIVMPANIVHSVKAVERFKMILIMIKS